MKKAEQKTMFRTLFISLIILSTLTDGNAGISSTMYRYLFFACHPDQVCDNGIEKVGSPQKRLSNVKNNKVVFDKKKRVILSQEVNDQKRLTGSNGATPILCVCPLRNIIFIEKKILAYFKHELHPVSIHRYPYQSDLSPPDIL